MKHGGGGRFSLRNLWSKERERGSGRGRDWETRVRKGRWKTREAEALGGPTGAA